LGSKENPRKAWITTRKKHIKIFSRKKNYQGISRSLKEKGHLKRRGREGNLFELPASQGGLHPGTYEPKSGSRRESLERNRKFLPAGQKVGLSEGAARITLWDTTTWGAETQPHRGAQSYQTTKIPEQVFKEKASFLHQNWSRRAKSKDLVFSTSLRLKGKRGGRSSCGDITRGRGTRKDKKEQRFQPVDYDPLVKRG